MKPMFDYNDVVEFVDSAPFKYRGFGRAWVVGVSEVQSREASALYDAPIGTPLYVIENGAGRSVEIPERYIQKV